MLNILDEVDRDTLPSKTFSKLSFGMALVMLGFGVYINSLIPENWVKEGLPKLHPILIWLGRLSIPASFIFTIMSFVQKEPSSFMKWAGAIFNTFVAVIAVITIVFWLKK